MKKDDFFCFCLARAKQALEIGYEKTEKPTLNSAQYNSRIDVISMQLWCMQDKERYCKCIEYVEEEKGD